MVEVESLTHYFSVTKGEDIKMAYNGKYSGINSYLWVSCFALPTIGSTLQVVERGNFMAYRDIGEMFINFMLSN